MPDPAGCAGCAGRSGRRAFLQQIAVGLAAALGGPGVGPAGIAALPVGRTRARSRGAGELAYPVPAANGVSIDREHEVILVRWESRVYAFALSCPHQRTMLKWRQAERRFQCPKHKSRYQPDGSFLSGRATRGMDRYRLRLAGAEVLVETTALFRQDEDEAGWNGAAVRLP